MNFQWIKKWFTRKKVDKQQEEAMVKEDIYLPYIREILEQLLEQRNLDYQHMRLLLIDKELEEHSLFEKEFVFETIFSEFDMGNQDDVSRVLSHLSLDLNFLIIQTERPEYFQKYVEKMYEETGLVVGVENKNSLCRLQANVVLDFEKNGRFGNEMILEKIIYIPIYRQLKEIVEKSKIFILDM